MLSGNERPQTGQVGEVCLSHVLMGFLLVSIARISLCGQKRVANRFVFLQTVTEILSSTAGGVSPFGLELAGGCPGEAPAVEGEELGAVTLVAG